jgi:hypothetical protein
VIKQHSWARQQYYMTHRRMRRGFTCEYLLDNLGVPNEVVRAADYSYQAYGYEGNGWLSDARRKRFQAIKWRIVSREELRF